MTKKEIEMFSMLLEIRESYNKRTEHFYNANDREFYKQSLGTEIGIDIALDLLRMGPKAFKAAGRMNR